MVCWFLSKRWSIVEVHKIWKATAPSLFTLAPDIYVPYVADIMDEYSYNGNPLFIPEVRKDAVTVSYCIYAFGKHNAICYSPFGIEDITLLPEEIDKPPMEVMVALNIDPSAFDITRSKDYLKRIYGLINDMKPLYLKYRGTDKLKSYCRKSETDYGTYLQFEEYNLQIAYAPKMPAKPLGAGMVYELDKNKFLLVGTMSTFTFYPKNGENKKVDIIKFEEGELKNGLWQQKRILNGDEKMCIQLKDMPSAYMIELYKY